MTAPKDGKRTTRPSRLTTEAAKAHLVEKVQQGMTVKGALDKVGYAYKTYEEWRRKDADFKARVDQARQLRAPKRDAERGERLGFEQWRKKYLGVDTPWHQLQWVDLLENREPRDLHDSQIYQRNRRDRIIVNCPPFHCPEVSTPVLTSEGWKTIGEVEVGDFVFGMDGIPGKVIETWQPESEVDLYEVEFSTGDVLVTDAQHRWFVENPVGKSFEKTTVELMDDLRYAAGQAKWRVPVSTPATGRGPFGEEPAPLPLDPYILGVWLGDGDTYEPRIAVSAEDYESLCAQIKAAGLDYSSHPQRGGHSVYVKGIRGILRSLGVLGHKHIPAAYAIAPTEQRMALLQGLMDSDGTVTAKDGRCSFSQNESLRPDLVRDTYRLISSLGFVPRKRDESKWNISPGTGELYWNAQTRIYFTPSKPVFRLERKMAKQRLQGATRTGARRIVDIRPAGRGMVKCLSVTCSGNLYQVGDGCIPQHNGKSVCITIDYSVYRLCMDPSYRIILISAGSELAKDFLFGIKQRLTSPEFLELQKAYAPDGGWESTAESWTETRIVFATETRQQGEKATHEKDANVIALGMRSKVYGRRADLIIVDDGVDTTNVSEHAKQMKWLRSMVESRLEAGGKLLVVGTRVAPVDLYSELMNPENYSNGRVPWTHLASPAILHEGKTPEEHVTLWPRAQAPWVPASSAAQGELCLCERPECSEGFIWGGERVYARWDGLHLELGPRAANSATDWALIYQQSGVSENATFPEHAIQKSTNTQRLCGRLEADRVGHPLGGMHGRYVIGGCDPAIKGFAGLVVIAVDRDSHKRYVLGAWNLKAPTGEELKAKMRELTEHYNINEWRVEKTGLLQFFTQDAAFRSWFASKGVRFTEHLTGGNKWDAGFGVSSMAPLFGEYDKAWDAPTGNWRVITEPLIELPRHNQDGMKALVHQLITWTPELDPSKTPCDLVMALWFANTGAREYLGVGRSGNVLSFGRSNPFTSPRSQKNRARVSLADLRQHTL